MIQVADQFMRNRIYLLLQSFENATILVETLVQAHSHNLVSL